MPKQKITYVDWKGKEKSIDVKKWKIDKMLPVKKELYGISYCILPDVEKMCKNNNLDYNSFLEWMYGQTMPVVESEGVNAFKCVYPWDLESWVYHNIRYNRNPQIWD